MKRKWNLLLIALLSLIITGCKGEYKIVINGSKLSEEITTYIYDSDHKKREYNSDKIDMANEFINSDSYAFFEDYNHLYNKKVYDKSDYQEVKLKYDYNMNNFAKSNFLNICFENSEVVNGKNTLKVSLSGHFHCLYGDSLDIKVKSKNKVIKNNADKKDGEYYIWTIDKDNYKSVDISLEVSKKSFWSNISIYLLCASIVLMILFIIVFIAMKRKKNNET